jgi:hypothetical protein
LKQFGGALKPITHAQKEMMLRYFEVVETELRAALEGSPAAGAPATDPSFIDAVAARVHGRIAPIATRIPESSAPSIQQIRKNLEAVLDPAFFGGAESDPIKAVRSLLHDLGCQPEYTPPKGGRWNRSKPAPRSKLR